MKVVFFFLSALTGVTITEVKGICHQGFLSIQSLPSERKNTIIALYDNVEKTDLIFPDLRFLCDGNISAVHFGAFFYSRRNSQWGKVLQATVTIWRANGVNYLNVGRHVIYHDLRTRSNRQGLTTSVVHPNEAYFLLSNSVLQIRESTSIPVKAGDIVGLSLLPDRNPWEDAIPVISLNGSSSSYVLTEEPDTTCWNADAEGFIPCHTVTGFAQPVMAVEFQESSQDLMSNTAAVVPTQMYTTSSSTAAVVPTQMYTTSSNTAAVVPTQMYTTLSSTYSSTPALPDLPSADVAVVRQGNEGAVVAAGVMGALLLLILIVLLIVSVLFLCTLKKMKGSYKTNQNLVAMTEQDEYLTTNPSVEEAVYESLSETGLEMCERREEEGGMTLDYSLLHQSDDKKRATLISQNNVETSYSSSVSYTKVDRRSQYLNPQMDGMPVPSMEDRKNMAVEDISNDTYAQCEEMENDLYWIPAQTKEGIYDQMSKKKYREVPRKCLTVRDLLGEGEFGKVFYGELLSSFGPVEVAVKVSNNADSEERVKLLQEAAVMGQFLHPRVVRLYGVVTFDEPNMVVIEYVKNGELLDYLDNIGLPAPADLPEKLLRFCTEICDGLNYLSKKGFIHRDLAARNILLDKDYHCKIADFGISRRLDDDFYFITKGGRIPLKWTAPEAIWYRKYSSKSDVWSYGMVMYEIWSLGHKPFEEFSTDEVLDIFGSGFCLSPPPGCPRGIYSLLVNCWNPDHHNRCSMQELFNALSSSHQETLLSWNEEDRSVSPQADVLGAPLEEGENLYRDLQMSYKQ